METVGIIAQIIVALGIFNVWLLRYNRSTPWRGGDAANMKEEFEVYGLPGWLVGVVGGLKVLFAVLLIVGIWWPVVTNAAALGVALLMLGAVSMHVKVRDPLEKSLPAFSMLVLSLIIVAV